MGNFLWCIVFWQEFRSESLSGITPYPKPGSEQEADIKLSKSKINEKTGRTEYTNQISQLA